MSVPEGQRSRGKLAIETEAENFLQYILNITTKYYLPYDANKTQPTEDEIRAYVDAKWFAECMRKEALSCLSNIQTANKIVIEDDETFHERRRLQTQAERDIENVMTAASLMYRRKLIKSKRIKHIGTQIGHMKRMIQNWRKSDKARYTKSEK